MIKRALVAFAGLLCVGSPLPAQSFFGGGLFDQPFVNSPWASLESQDRFAFSSGFGSMNATNREFLPAFNPSQPLSYGYLARDNKSPVDQIVDLRRPNDIRFGGEIGFLYGTSASSHGFGREDYAGYIIGTVGNDKFSITAGFYRQETNFSGRGFRR